MSWDAFSTAFNTVYFLVITLKIITVYFVRILKKQIVTQMYHFFFYLEKESLVCLSVLNSNNKYRNNIHISLAYFARQQTFYK